MLEIEGMAWSIKNWNVKLTSLHPVYAIVKNNNNKVCVLPISESTDIFWFFYITVLELSK